MWRFPVLIFITFTPISVERTWSSNFKPLAVRVWKEYFPSYRALRGGNPENQSISRQIDEAELNKELWNASKIGAMYRVDDLVTAGANVDARDLDGFGFCAIHFAAESGKCAVLALLVARGSDVNAEDDNYITPLHIAAERGYEGAVVVLLELGAKINANDARGFTPLHLAARAGNVLLVERLLDSGALAELKDLKGRTAAKLATEHQELHGEDRSATLRVLQRAVASGPLDPTSIPTLSRCSSSSKPAPPLHKLGSLPSETTVASAKAAAWLANRTREQAVREVLEEAAQSAAAPARPTTMEGPPRLAGETESAWRARIMEELQRDITARPGAGLAADEADLQRRLARQGVTLGRALYEIDRRFPYRPIQTPPGIRVNPLPGKGLIWPPPADGAGGGDADEREAAAHALLDDGPGGAGAGAAAAALGGLAGDWNAMGRALDERLAPATETLRELGRLSALRFEIPHAAAEDAEEDEVDDALGFYQDSQGSAGDGEQDHHSPPHKAGGAPASVRDRAGPPKWWGWTRSGKMVRVDAERVARARARDDACTPGLARATAEGRFDDGPGDDEGSHPPSKPFPEAEAGAGGVAGRGRGWADLSDDVD